MNETAGALGDWQEVRAHLVAAAAAGHALTYSELLEHLGYGFSRPKMRALCKTLGVVDDDAEERGEPEGSCHCDSENRLAPSHYRVTGTRNAFNQR